MSEKEFVAYIDGASSGNPGHAGIGIVVYDGDDMVMRESKYIGETTNNVAEYTALLTLLELLKKKKMKKVKVFSDSELLVKQLSGEYKIKNDNLRDFVARIQAHRKDITFTVMHTAREGNAEADKLAKSGSMRGKNADARKKSPGEMKKHSPEGGEE